MFLICLLLHKIGGDDGGGGTLRRRKARRVGAKRSNRGGCLLNLSPILTGHTRPVNKGDDLEDNLEQLPGSRGKHAANDETGNNEYKKSNEPTVELL